MKAHFNFKFVVNEVFPTKQKKQFTNVDVLSYIGGMLGLLSGFSLLSLVELFYIFILKPVLRLAKLKRVHPEPVNTNFHQRKTNFLTKYLSKSSVHSFYYIANEIKMMEK
jgi:hypothetical protein